MGVTTVTAMQQNQDLNKVSAHVGRDASFNPHHFDGSWRIDVEGSVIRDEATGEMVRETLADQWMERSTAGDVITCQMHVQIAPDLTTHMEYVVRLDDDAWAPYTCVGIDGDVSDPRLQPGETSLLKAGTIIGQPIAWMKIVYVDERTQVRITRNLDGTPQYILQSRLSEDRDTLMGALLLPDGSMGLDKRLLRESR